MNGIKDDPLVGCEIIQLKKDDWDDMMDDIIKIELEFQDRLRDSKEDLKLILNFSDSVFLLLKKDDKIIGYAAGSRLEDFKQIPGVKEDAHFGLNDTFYLESWIILKKYQNAGYGRHLLNHLFLKVKARKFSYLTGHFSKNYGVKLGGIQQITFPKWYGRNRFKYCRIHLSEASWIESCKTMITVESILAGFTAVILAVLLSISSSEIIPFALFAIISSIGLFIYSAEKSTDAIDERVPITYINTLVYYNFAVTLLFIGMSIIIYDYIDRNITDWPFQFKLMILVFIAVGGSFRWVKDGIWLLDDDKKMEYLRALEKGMRFTV